jgi:ABC-type Mn2+/Zn2+ transport system permease subunit
LSAGLCAYIGVYLILKRIVFVGIALAEVAALGIAMGLFFGLSPTYAALATTIMGAILLWSCTDVYTLPRESLIALTYCLAASLAIILIAKNPMAEARGINLISGNLLYIDSVDLWTIGGITLLVLPLHITLFRQFIFVSFDKETARAQGVRASLYDFLIYLSIGVVVAGAIKIAGVLFVFAALVVPPMVGLILGRRTQYIFLISTLIAGGLIPIGLWVSYRWDFPSGPTTVCIYSMVYMLIVLFRRMLLE